jgi:hypothetical protein
MDLPQELNVKDVEKRIANSESLNAMDAKEEPWTSRGPIIIDARKCNAAIQGIAAIAWSGIALRWSGAAACASRDD